MMIEQFEEERVNELTDSIVKMYLEKKKQNPQEIICVDIEGIIKELYGYKIEYETIVEDDPSIIAYSANGIRPLKVKRNNQICNVVFPNRTIVLDNFLKKQKNSTQKRFVLAHELGHKIYSSISPEHARGNYAAIFDKDYNYSLDQIKQQMNICELEANKFGCAILMPRFLLVNTLHRIMGAEKLKLYGERQILPGDALKVKQMTDDIGVSLNMLLRELRSKHLIEYHGMDEYLKIVGLNGGECIV